MGDVDNVPPPIQGADHFAGTTTDRDRNVGFYRDVLGFVLTRDDLVPSGNHGNLSYTAPGADRPLLYFTHTAQAEPDAVLHRPIKSLALAPPPGATDSAFDYWGDRLDAAGVRFEDDPNIPWLWTEDPDGLGVEIGLGYGEGDDGPTIEFSPGEEIPSAFELTRIRRLLVESDDPLSSATSLKRIFGFALHNQAPPSGRPKIFNSRSDVVFEWLAGEDRAATPQDGPPNHAALSSSIRLAEWQAYLTERGVAVSELELPEPGCRALRLEDDQSPFEIVCSGG